MKAITIYNEKDFRTMTIAEINEVINEIDRQRVQLDRLYTIAEDENNRAEMRRLDHLCDIVEDNSIYAAYELNRRESAERFEAQKLATAERFGVALSVVECLRDIETLTAEEARQKYTAEELGEALMLSEREDHYNGVKSYLIGAEAQDETNDDNQGGELIESAINFVEVDEVPTFEGSPVADKLRRMASITAKAVKTASKKAAALLALVVCLAVGLGSMFICCWACGLGLDAIEEAQGAALPWLLRFALCVGCMFTIILDFCCWAELQIMRVFEKLHAFDGFGGIYYRGEEKGLFIRPFSVIGTMISNIKNA